MEAVRSNKLRRSLSIASTVLVIVILVVAAVTYQRWLPLVPGGSKLIGLNSPQSDADDHDHGHTHGPDEADAHVHASHDDDHFLELSEVAWKNIGLVTGVVQPTDYVRTVSVPARIAERSGRSQVAITTPLTGIVTHVYSIEGEAVLPGQPLFDLRLTHEDLVKAQRDFLQSAQERDVIVREMERLKSAGDGVIPGRRILEQQYEMEKIEAAMHAQQQGLLLHGLDDAQIASILRTRQLLQVLTVSAPEFGLDADHGPADHLFHVQSIGVKRGESVLAGAELGVLADHCLLYVEGQAFEQDAQRLIEAARAGTELDVYETSADASRGTPLRLRVTYVADHVDPESRALSFFLLLPNELVRDQQSDGHRYVAWRFRTGQRMDVRLPLGEPWLGQIVLPPEAVVVEGADAFVFEQNGEHFDRVPVHLLYQDKNSVVLENDGQLIGSHVALSGAYQIHLAIKNKSGGGIDPHAGHSH